MNRFLDRIIRVPLEVVENKRLTANEKLFYAILLDSIVGNEIAVINGNIADIKMRESFANVYKYIQTIKQGNKLIAERKDGKLVLNVDFEAKLRK